MVFVVTARHSFGPTTASGATATSDSVQPTADSLLLAFWSSQRDNHTQLEDPQTPSGGGYSYTQRDTVGPESWDGSASFAGFAALYSALVGSSPSSHTITVDSWATAAVGVYSVVACDITGYDSTNPFIQTAINSSEEASIDNAVGTVALASALTTGSLVVIHFSSGADAGGGFATPTIGGQSMTPLFNQNGNWVQSGLWYREIDGTESNATITCSDVGDSVGNWLAIAVEIAADAGGGDQELNIPFFENINQIFAPVVQSQGNQDLSIPHKASDAQIFAPVIENQAAQELNIPHHASEAQIFIPSVITGDHQLDIPFKNSEAQIFAPTVENQTAQILNIPHHSSESQIFPVALENQINQELNIPHFAGSAQIFVPTIVNEGDDLFEPILAGNGSLADQIFNGLISQGFLTGSLADRERARLLAKLTLTEPQNLSIQDLYELADEDNRISGLEEPVFS